MVAQLLTGLVASPALAELGTKTVALLIFAAWILRERRSPAFAAGRPSDARAAWTIVPLVAMVLALNLDQSLAVELSAPLLLAGLLSACWEELAFRGVLMGKLAGFGARTSAWISSLGFGLLHAVQPDLLSAALSVFMTTGLGLSLGALRLRTGSLWPAVLAHAAINLSAYATVGASPAAQSPLPWVPMLLGSYFLAYGAFLLSLLPAAPDPGAEG